jgi:hypothetical protein
MCTVTSTAVFVVNLLTVFLVKVMQPHYRPGVAQGVPMKLRFPDFMTAAQDGGKVYFSSMISEFFFKHFCFNIPVAPIITAVIDHTFHVPHSVCLIT